MIEDFLSILLVTISLALVHLFSKSIHDRFYQQERKATSFAGGMAITYVFINLLPELRDIETFDIGGIPIYSIVALSGFLLFYGLQRLAWKVNFAKDREREELVFYIEILAYSLYSFLLIYAIPKKLLGKTLFTTVAYIITIGFHLLNKNYFMIKKHGHRFHKMGRYVLVASIVAGFITDMIDQNHPEWIYGVLLAILIGILLFNIFTDELPDSRESSFRWFTLGTVAFFLMHTASTSFVDSDSKSAAERLERSFRNQQNHPTMQQRSNGMSLNPKQTR
ncbi:MAG: hypothetical protein F6K19_21100 [Cyanothece sp. SIO1E1]|nr:hypothetical protein [Cyanothece sp. SIO1E1]